MNETGCQLVAEREIKAGGRERPDMGRGLPLYDILSSQRNTRDRQIRALYRNTLRSS